MDGIRAAEELAPAGSTARGRYLVVKRPVSHLFPLLGASILEDEMPSTCPVCFGSQHFKPGPGSWGNRVSD